MPNVIVFQGGFHGRTLATVSLTTSKRIVRSGYQPLLPGVFPAPFPYAYRYGWPSDATLAWCLAELRHLIETQTAPEETAAILVEPVLGEGGYVVPPAGVLPTLGAVQPGQQRPSRITRCTSLIGAPEGLRQDGHLGAVDGGGIGG